jgi:F-type H+-transporting ATPase subunit b
VVSILWITQFGDSSSGIGALGINVSSFVIQLLTFLLALWLLQRYAFKPILRVLGERRAVIENGVKLGEEMKKQQSALEQKVSAALHDARAKADDIVTQAEHQARRTVQTAEEKAREKADAVVSEADDRIAQDLARARQQLESEMINLVSEATEIIIHEKVDTKKDAALIEAALRGERRS